MEEDDGYSDGSDDEHNIDYEDVKSEENMDNLDHKPPPIVVVPDNKRKSAPILTGPDRSRVIEARATLLDQGYPPAPYILINNIKGSSREIAEIELSKDLIPLLLGRPLNNGKMELWRLPELQQMNDK